MDFPLQWGDSGTKHTLSYAASGRPLDAHGKAARYVESACGVIIGRTVVSVIP